MAKLINLVIILIFIGVLTVWSALPLIDFILSGFKTMKVQYRHPPHVAELKPPLSWIVALMNLVVFFILFRVLYGIIGSL